MIYTQILLNLIQAAGVLWISWELVKLTRRQ